jgi:hypothetical protein
VTLQAAGGFAAYLFPTGKGHVSGKPIKAVIESLANPRTARVMPQHIDVDVSGLLHREITIDEAGDKLIALTLRVCNGRMTCAEALKHCEYSLTRLYQSALSFLGAATLPPSRHRGGVRSPPPDKGRNRDAEKDTPCVDGPVDARGFWA